MPGDVEFRLTPRSDELVGTIASVKTDAESVLAKHAEDFGEGGLEPRVVVIVRDGATVVRRVVHEIRRIGKDEIDAGTAKFPHDLDAVALKDSVVE
jgi:hypothetical protein